MLKTTAALASALCLLACETTSGGAAKGGNGYGADAKENYDIGSKELADKNYLEAQRYLEYVSAKFPYSNYSALADLGLGDLYFQQEKYVEAIDKYRNFMKLHPTHPKCDYASFQVARAYEEQIPSDFFILPPSAEKDQTDVHNALVAYNDFLGQFPASELRPKAQEKTVELRKRLADHEMRIAKFYEEHERPAAAAGRYETVLREYGGTGFEGVAALQLNKVYGRMNQPDKARDALQRFLKDHPDDPRAADAKRLLEHG